MKNFDLEKYIVVMKFLPENSCDFTCSFKGRKENTRLNKSSRMETEKN